MGQTSAISSGSGILASAWRPLVLVQCERLDCDYPVVPARVASDSPRAAKGVADLAATESCRRMRDATLVVVRIGAAPMSDLSASAGRLGACATPCKYRESPVSADR
jgi:hypothetical protein